MFNNFNQNRFQLIPVGSFITNSLRKNKYEADVLLINESDLEKDKILRLWNECIQKDSRKIFNSTIMNDINQEKIIKVFVENLAANTEMALNFYVISEKNMNLTKILKINQEYLNFLVKYNNNIEELLILRKISKIGVFKSSILNFYIYYIRTFKWRAY